MSPFAFGLIKKNVDPARLINRGSVIVVIMVAVVVAGAGAGAIAIIVVTVIVVIVIIVVIVVVVSKKPFDRGVEVVIVITNPLSSC